MKKEIKVLVKGLGEVGVEKGYTLEEVAKKAFGKDYRRYFGARINNELFHLHKKIDKEVTIEFISLKDDDGYKIYTRTIAAVFIMAVDRVLPQCTVKVEHFVGEGLYVELGKGKSISFSEIDKIKKEMQEIIRQDITIIREKVSGEKGIELFEKQGYDDKVRLYKTLDYEEIQTYRIGDHIDGFHGFLAPSTAYVSVFDLRYYYPGALILFPTKETVDTLPEFKDRKKLAKVFEEANKWAEILDLGYVGSLNEKILKGDIGEVIRISEALQEKKIGHIADEICKDNDINIILIGGPSSSGKTTFAQRLGIHLKVNGKRPILISVDDYFLDRDKTPLNDKGEYDFESIHAIDLQRLNEDLVRLLEGEEVELPKYNFLTGKNENSGLKIKVDREHPIIVEGIHGLNPNLTTYIPDKNKFKIYISALTQLNIDAHNRISTTDTRLIRRMVRDNKFRGNDIFRTFELWKGVVKGEEQNIFPYQEEADVMFDSALAYELSVLKKHAIPLLQEVDNTSYYYSECRRLLQFLRYFIDIEDESLIPPNSILREFIGGADVNVH